MSRLESVTIKPASRLGTQTTLVVVECEACGWAQRINLSDAPHGYADRLADKHRCPEGSGT